jgi:hypothetical protein
MPISYRDTLITYFDNSNGSNRYGQHTAYCVEILKDIRVTSLDSVIFVSSKPFLSPLLSTNAEALSNEWCLAA